MGNAVNLIRRIPRFQFRLLAILLPIAIPTNAQESPGAVRGGLLETLPLRKDFEARRASSANDDLAKNGDARPIEPGDTLLLGDLEGPGVITHLWNTCNARDPFYSRSLVLRIYWDGESKPSVEVPLGDFFGVGHAAEESFQSLPVVNTAHGRSRNCFWKMPFRRHAKVTVTNESPIHKVDSFYYHLDWEKHERLPDDAAYFHARYRQETPARPGDYTLLETHGRGHFVGMVYSVHSVKNGWFGEGDDRFYIDGETFPSLRGTGTEDYFGDAWGLHREASPFLGVSLWDGYVAGDRATAYRWHLTDPIPFRDSLKVAFEHRGSVYNDLLMPLGTFVERPDWISSVAFWYQYPPVSSDETLPPVDKRVAPYRVLPAEELVTRATPAAIVNKSRDGIAYLPMKPDAKIEFDFEIMEPGRYQIAGWLLHSLASGRYQPHLDGKPVGPELDLNREGADAIRVSFDLHDLLPGTHTLSFEGRGASPFQRSRAPKAYALGLKYLTLLRLQDMDGYSTPIKN